MWYTIKNQQVKISIIAKPKAKKTALVKVDEQGLHISLHANPHGGEANEELIEFLAEFFKVPKSKILLDRGATGRRKQVVLPLTESVKQILQNLSV